jgi:hypothetical protein
MKRIRPDPTGPVALSPDLKRPCLEPQYTTLGSMPQDIVSIVLGFLDFKSILSFGQTCDAYQKISTNDRLWENLLLRDFSNTPILGEQRQFGLEEYKRQCRFVCNLIRGSFTSQFFPTKEQGVFATALTPDGRFIISCLDSSVKISANLMTNHWVTLHQDNHSNIHTLLCEGDVCIGMHSTGRMRGWNTRTYAEIPIPQGGKGFSLEREPGDAYLMKLIQGRLLKANCFKRIIEVWNLESNDDRVLSFSFNSRIDYMTFHNKTLFCGRSDGNVELCDITTNDRSLHPSIGIPRQIYVASDTKYFAAVAKKILERPVIKRINHENNPPIVSSLVPLSYPGVAGQFTGSWSSELGTEQCSLSELSSIFQAFSSNIFGNYDVAESLRLPQLSILGKLFRQSSAPIHNCGKLYFPTILQLAFNTKESSDTVMFCADFTASDRDILLEIARLFDDESLIDTATKRLMNMPESVKNAISKVYKKIDFVSEKNPPALLWRAAILEYLAPGSIIREEQLLRKVIGLLVSEDELERAYGTDSFRKRISPSAQEAITKIGKEVASRPDFAKAKPEAILATAIIEYLENQSLEKVNEVIMIEG